MALGVSPLRSHRVPLGNQQSKPLCPAIKASQAVILNIHVCFFCVSLTRLSTGTNPFNNSRDVYRKVFHEGNNRVMLDRLDSHPPMVRLNMKIVRTRFNVAGINASWIIDSRCAIAVSTNSLIWPLLLDESRSHRSRTTIDRSIDCL